jgi:xylulose-5-phosphate/fructose-6-phosphate phosphoketolase
VLAGIGRQQLTDLIRGYSYELYFVEGDVLAVMHQCLAATLDAAVAEIHDIQEAGRSSPRWSGRRPMIVFLTPKGWSGPKFADGKPIEKTWRAHPVPITDFENPEHLKRFEGWMQNYRPMSCSTKQAGFATSSRRWRGPDIIGWGTNPHAKGGKLLLPLALLHFEGYAVTVAALGVVEAEPPACLERFCGT